MADFLNALLRRRRTSLRELPEGVGAETELLGGPEDDYHEAMDVPRWKGPIPETGLAPEMPRYGTPEIGLAPEMPNALMKRADTLSGEGPLPSSVARRGEDYRQYSKRRLSDPNDVSWGTTSRAEGRWIGNNESPSPMVRNENTPLDDHLANYQHIRADLMARQGREERARNLKPLPANPTQAEVTQRVMDGSLTEADMRRLEATGRFRFDLQSRRR